MEINDVEYEDTIIVKPTDDLLSVAGDMIRNDVKSAVVRDDFSDIIGVVSLDKILENLTVEQIMGAMEDEG